MRKASRSPRNQWGFGTVELLVTLLVASVFIIVFYQLYVTVGSINNRAYLMAQATKVAYAKLQAYENKDFAVIPTPGGVSSASIEDFKGELPTTLPSPKTAQVSSAVITPTLKAVDIKVTYGAEVAPQIIEYTTYIQESGLGR
jgi:hypothetical protein